MIYVDEFKISQVCSNPEYQTQSLEDILADDSVKLYRVRKFKKCSILWQRDVNAARNIHYISSEIVAGHPRPDVSFRTTTTTLSLH